MKPKFRIGNYLLCTDSRNYVITVKGSICKIATTGTTLTRPEVILIYTPKKPGAVYCGSKLNVEPGFRGFKKMGKEEADVLISASLI